MKIILNIMTHGNERIGLKVAKEIKKLKISEDILTIQIANPKAMEQNKRFIDQDLNRSFPGKKNGNYEQKLAYRLLPKIKKADLVIDIHSTTSELKDTLIVTRMDKRIQKYIKIVAPKYLLLMNATNGKDLISHTKCGIAFEYGKDKDVAVLKKIVQDIARLFVNLGIINMKLSTKNTKTQYFDVFAITPKSKGDRLLKNIKNYRVIKKGQPYAKNGKNFLKADRDFYPVLFGQKNYETMFGFRGKKIFVN